VSPLVWVAVLVCAGIVVAAGAVYYSPELQRRLSVGPADDGGGGGDGQEDRYIYGDLTFHGFYEESSLVVYDTERGWWVNETYEEVDDIKANRSYYFAVTGEATEYGMQWYREKAINKGQYDSYYNLSYVPLRVFMVVHNPNGIEAGDVKVSAKNALYFGDPNAHEGSPWLVQGRQVDANTMVYTLSQQPFQTFANSKGFGAPDPDELKPSDVRVIAWSGVWFEHEGEYDLTFYVARCQGPNGSAGSCQPGEEVSRNVSVPA